MIAKNHNWIEGFQKENSFRGHVKIRYIAELTWSDIELIQNDTLQISFDHPLQDLTPGQIAVVYDGDGVLGTGKINRAFNEIREE